MRRSATVIVLALAAIFAAGCDALGVETERGRGILVRLRLDHGLDLQSLVAQFRSTLTATPSQLHLSDRGAWRDILVSMLRELGRMQRAKSREMAASV